MREAITPVTEPRSTADHVVTPPVTKEPQTASSVDRSGFDFSSLQIHAVASHGDPLEHEAHANADRIAGARPDSPGRRMSPPASGASAGGLGSGQPLDVPTRRRFESELDADLTSVRVHADPAAAESSRRLGAAAYSVGNHVVLGRGFEQSTNRGTWLLAHELTHVVQHAALGQRHIVHRAPEDVPMLEKQFDEGVAAGGADGFRKAAEALNAFADFDIRRLISASPGPGRKPLGRGQIAALHQAAIDDPKLGPNSNAATITRPAYLDMNFSNDFKQGKLESAAEFLNAFNEADMTTRLRRLTVTELKNVQLGGLRNPRLGAGSAVVKNAEIAIKAATQAQIQTAAAQVSLPTTTSGTGPPGTITSVSVGSGGGNANIGIPPADRESLPSGADAKTDPQYIDNNISRASYDVLTGLFEIDYGKGGFIYLDLDTVLKGAKSGSPALQSDFFKNKKNGRIYPANYNRRDLPNIVACALEIERNIPAAHARVIGAMIDVAISAHGVANATLRASQAMAGPTSGGKTNKPAAKDPEPKPSPKPAATGGGGKSTGGGTADAPGGMSAAPAGKSTGGGSGGKPGGGQLQQVTPSKSGPPVQDLPSEIKWPKVSGETPLTGAGFVLRSAYGTAKVAGKVLGEGALMKAAPTARVVGATTTIAEGAVEVAGVSIAKALVVTGGKFIPQAVANAGRVVLYALVLQDVTYLIVSPAEGTDQPAQAPGKDTGTVTAPGKDTGTVTAPGKDSGAPITDPTDKTPMQAPGPLVDEAAECKKLIGSKVTHDHHVFPQKFRQRFKDLGIDIDEFTITLGWQEHVGKNGLHASFGWNDEWDVFFDDVPDVSKMTPEQARGWQLRAKNFGYRLMVEAGIDRKRLHPYRK